MWQAFKDGIAESARGYFAPLKWYARLYKGETWPHKIMTAILTVWFILSLGFILSLFDK